MRVDFLAYHDLRKKKPLKKLSAYVCKSVATHASMFNYAHREKKYKKLTTIKFEKKKVYEWKTYPHDKKFKSCL